MMAERDDSFTVARRRRRIVLPPSAAGIRPGRSAVASAGDDEHLSHRARLGRLVGRGDVGQREALAGQLGQRALGERGGDRSATAWSRASAGTPYSRMKRSTTFAVMQARTGSTGSAGSAA